MLDDQLIQNLETHIKKGRKMTKKDLLQIPSISNNPLSRTIISLYTKTIEGSGDGKKIVDFTKMMQDLYKFVSKKTDLDFKLRLLFNLYDSDRDGYISNWELCEMLERLTECNIDGDKIQNIVDQTFREMRTHKISYEDFLSLIKKKTKNIETYFMSK